MNQIKERGLLYLVGVIACRVVPAWIFRFRVFSIYELADSGRDPAHPSDARLAPTNSPQALADLCKSPSAINRGNTGWEFQKDSEVVGGLWLARTQFHESDLGVTIKLAEKTAWLFSTYVIPSHRRQGIYHEMLHQLHRTQQEGTRVYFAISSHNRASIAAHRSHILGTRATVFAIRAFGLTASYCSPPKLLRQNTISLPGLEKTAFVEGDITRE